MADFETLDSPTLISRKNSMTADKNERINQFDEFFFAISAPI